MRPLIGLAMKGEGQRLAEVLVQYLNQGPVGIKSKLDEMRSSVKEAN